MQSFTDLENAAGVCLDSGVQGAARAHPHPSSAQLRITTEHTLERTPNLQKTALANENLNRLQFSVYRIRRRRLRMADAEGLRGNEA